MSKENKIFDKAWGLMKEERFHGEDEEGNPYDRFAEMAWADNPINRPFILDCKACTDIDEETGIRRFVGLCPAHYMQYKANEAAQADHDNTPPDDFYYRP